MRKFNYILNDLAFDTLVIKCLYGEPTDEDVKECENQIELLKQKNNQLKEVIEEVREKCKEPRKEMDYTVWLKLRHYIDTLEEFGNDIEHCLHPIITTAYKSSIKNAIKELCEIIKYKIVYKEDIKDILDKAKEISNEDKNL